MKTKQTNKNLLRLLWPIVFIGLFEMWLLQGDLYRQVIINVSGKMLTDKSQLLFASIMSCEWKLTEAFLSAELHTGLSSSQTVMAHGCYLSAEELDVFRDQGASIAYCPNSNLSYVPNNWLIDYKCLDCKWTAKYVCFLSHSPRSSSIVMFDGDGN